MHLTSLATLAESLGCRVTPHAPMAAATTFRVGGPADMLVDIPDPAAVAELLACCHREEIPCLWLGNGSNLVVGDKGIRGAVLRLCGRRCDPVLTDDTTVTASAGISLQRLALFARDHALTGLEFAHGIPGSLGGGVYMNAGAYDGQMADVIVSVTAVTPAGEMLTLTKDDLNMTYRHTALMDSGTIVTSATVALRRGEKEAIDARMKDLMARRRDKQPLEYPSAGSFFKRPEGYFAGALIEQTGLKGYRVGGAMVSEKHAGFIINAGGATAADIRRLCADVQEKVFAAHGVRMEPEVRFVGEF